MKRLLLLTPDFPPKRGGVARYLDALAATFRDDVLVMAPPETGSEPFDAACGYPVERRRLEFRTFWPHWLRSLFILFQYRSRYDLLVVSHVIPFGFVAYLNKKLTGKPYIVILHGLDYELAKRSTRKWRLAHLALRNAKNVITNSEWLKRMIAKDVPKTDIRVVYPAISERVLNGAKTAETSGAERPFTFLTVARLIERKGHLRVLAAMAALPEDIRAKVGYHIVGDGPMKGRLAAEIHHLGLSDAVRLSTDVSDDALSEIYRSSDCFVMPVVDLPDDREGFGTVYLEAAACGLPSIASDLPGVNEAVLDNQTGMLVREGDRPALIAAMRRLCEDKELRDRLGANAKRRALTDFSREAQFTKLKSVFE